MPKIIYVPELPKGLILNTGTLILAGTKLKGADLDERLYPQEREQVELYCRHWKGPDHRKKETEDEEWF